MSDKVAVAVAVREELVFCVTLFVGGGATCKYVIHSVQHNILLLRI